MNVELIDYPDKIFRIIDSGLVQVVIGSHSLVTSSPLFGMGTRIDTSLDVPKSFINRRLGL